MSKSDTNSKPLKGRSFTADSGTFDTISANNLEISPETMESLLNGTQLDGVTIVNSQIDNTTIGINGSTIGYFTALTTNGDVIMYNSDKNKYVSWDANTSILTVNGELSVTGCGLFGNIEICNNTIQAINTNGDINIKPNGIGSLFLTGPIVNIVASTGNFISNLSNGHVSFTSNDYIGLISTNSSIGSSSFSNQLFKTVNGDITLTTETGIGGKFITLIDPTGGNVRVTTSQSSNLKTGDIVVLSGTNSNPILDGTYIVKSVINTNSFLISTGNTFSGIIDNSTTGSATKSAPTNNINLNAGVYVKIPSNIKLTFGTTQNNISGNTTDGILINSIKDVFFTLPGSNKISIPQNTKLSFGTSGNNYLNYDGSNTNINSDNIKLSSDIARINSTDIYMKDPNPMISNFSQGSDTITDKGIQFRYYNASSGSILGWYGFKTSLNKFTFLQNITNTDEIITGTPGDIDVGNITTSSITISPGSFINMNCGSILNVRLITGCGGVVNINGSSNVNISSSNRISLISNGDIFIPNNIPLTLGSSGSFIKENSVGNVILTSFNNTFMNANTVVIPIGSKVSFDGNTSGNQSISSNTSGNLLINTNKNLIVLLTSGNIIIPSSTSNSASSIQFGNVSETIYGSTNGMNILTQNSNLNLIANSNVNVSSSLGNIVIRSNNGEVNLLSNAVRINVNSKLIFNISGTSNSITSVTNGNLLINGNGTNGNIIIENANNINLSANSNINIPSNVYLNIGSNYILSDTTSNLYITNTSSNINVSSIGLNMNNTITNVNNSNTNISSNNFTLSGGLANINSNNVKMTDPILTLANYNTIDLKDRGVEYNWYNISTGNYKMGWFGWKNSTSQFTFYSDSINTNEIISGTLGQFALGSVVVSNNISFLNTGNIDMNCGTISNLNTIFGCHGTININSSSNVNVNSSNILLNAKLITVPYNAPIIFGSTSNSINSDSNGNLTISCNNGNGSLILNSNVQINGTTNNVYSTITNYQDPILSIGGVIGPVVSDLKDRGIEFKWTSGTTANTGFFGFQNATQRFIFMANDINTNEIVSGTLGNVQFANGYFSNLDTSCGTISNVSVLTGCSSAGLSIISNNVNISSSNINLGYNTNLNFGSTRNSINGNSSGILNINSSDTVLTSNKLIFNTTNYAQFSENSPVYFGNITNGNYLLRNTSGNFNIVNSTGSIYITPNNSVGSVIIPENTSLIFGNTTTNIISDGTNLQLNGYSVGINSTTTITFNGNVNIIGNLSALSTVISTDSYIFPLGTQQTQIITNIVNSTTVGSVNITTSLPNYLSVGDSISTKNTDSVPTMDGFFTVSQIIDNTTFSIVHSSISTPGSTGLMYSNLTTYQGKDVGIEVNYWKNNTVNGVTSGSAYFKTGFFGWRTLNDRWTFYNEATISNNVVTQGILGDVQINELYANKISGFTLDGPIVGGSFTITGNNFQIGGGNIDNTPIGQTTAQSGRFTSLASTVNTSLHNVTLQSTLNYSLERFTVSSMVPNTSPNPNVITSLITVFGTGFTTPSGTMGSSGIADGQIKKIYISACGINCQYTLFFGSGKLIVPNPLNNTLPTKLVFNSTGQSSELIYDSTLGSWSLIGGTGCYPQ